MTASSVKLATKICSGAKVENVGTSPIVGEASYLTGANNASAKPGCGCFSLCYLHGFNPFQRCSRA